MASIRNKNECKGSLHIGHLPLLVSHLKPAEDTKNNGEPPGQIKQQGGACYERTNE